MVILANEVFQLYWVGQNKNVIQTQILIASFRQLSRLHVILAHRLSEIELLISSNKKSELMLMRRATASV